MLQPGDVAPEFILPGEDGQDISLTKMLQDSALILYFYPADFTPGCTKEACAIRDIHDDILSVGLRVLGISPQDEEKTAIKMYDADGPMGYGVRRITYLVNQGQKIQDAIQANLQIGQHSEFIRKAIMLRETAGMKVSSESD
jgi:peroxiredoxin Q/BCP